jgi:hypothetical protein
LNKIDHCGPPSPPKVSHIIWMAPNSTELFKNSVRKKKAKICNRKFGIFPTPFQAKSTKMHPSLASPHYNTLLKLTTYKRLKNCCFSGRALPSKNFWVRVRHCCILFFTVGKFLYLRRNYSSNWSQCLLRSVWLTLCPLPPLLSWMSTYFVYREEEQNVKASYVIALTLEQDNILLRKSDKASGRIFCQITKSEKLRKPGLPKYLKRPNLAIM